MGTRIEVTTGLLHSFISEVTNENGCQGILERLVNEYVLFKTDSDDAHPGVYTVDNQTYYGGGLSAFYVTGIGASGEWYVADSVVVLCGPATK